MGHNYNINKYENHLSNPKQITTMDKARIELNETKKELIVEASSNLKVILGNLKNELKIRNLL